MLPFHPTEPFEAIGAKVGCGAFLTVTVARKERPLRVVSRPRHCLCPNAKTPWQACQGVVDRTLNNLRVGSSGAKELSTQLRRLPKLGANAKTPQSADQGVVASGCYCFVDDDVGHRPVFREYPTLSGWDVSGGHRGFDLPPSAMRRKTDHGIPNPGTGAAGLAGRVRIRRRADRYSPSSRRIPRQ
jgi:hypothetical protein